jgi:UDP-N-acetylglucosamine 2-epimerase (non-hydrolysing)
VLELLDDSSLYQVMSVAHNPYGDGTASKQILEGVTATANA